MSDPENPWDGNRVRRWLDSRVAAARSEQARADKRGYGHEDDYDKAAAEEWACRAAAIGDAADDQARFATSLKALLARDEYRMTGVHDDARAEREVRACLRKLAKMTKANTDFENVSRYQ